MMAVLKLILIILISSLSFGCKAQNQYKIEEINEDSCTASYYRLRMKCINNDSIYQVLSEKDTIKKSNLKIGDIIKINLITLNRSDVKDMVKMRPDNYIFYCGDKIILQEHENFYKSENIKGLRILN